ncbi:MAG: glycosyltransferase [Candidatus Omnitrophica bacterium]|nr:glycosyltransferase [Candidatus Omnitrophota bacterium]
MTVSIIIAVKAWQKNLAVCLDKCQGLNFKDFEILVLPDKAFDSQVLPVGSAPVSIIPTGPVSPAEKRDIALCYAKAPILAFIDDDTYPDKDWLKNAVGNFSDPEIAAVGGPAITPGEDTLKARASGIIYSSFLVSGKFVYRYLPMKRQEVDDYPSCNFLVRKSIMDQLGGFKTNFWPGEDTKLCLQITQELKKKIIYDPRALLYHHRRELFIPHIRQILSYALHRGYFAKRFPETSLRLYYFIPSIFVFLSLSGGLIGLFFEPVRFVYFIGIYIYLAIVFFTAFFLVSAQSHDFLEKGELVFLVWSGIILTHITYGGYFIKGLLSNKLQEEK